MSETLTIFGIDYPNTEGFKAKDDLGTTHTYAEGGGGGNDLPVFTITYDSDDDYSVISATCDKTYSELNSMIQAGTLAGAIENAIIVGSDSYEYSKTLAVLSPVGVPSGADHLPAGDYLYFISSEGQPLYDVYYSESNVVYIINPSLAARTLTVTENGNYTLEYDDYSWVEVNVDVAPEDYILTVEQDQTDFFLFLPTEPYADIMAGISAADINYHRVFIATNDYAVSSELHMWNYSDDAPPITADNKNFFKYTTYYIYSEIGNGNIVVTEVVLGLVNGVYDYAIVDRHTSYNGELRTSSDLTVSGSTVTAPAGFYANAATKAVASGTEGTPIATKGTVSNHAVSVTPSVTNSAGYISGGTKTGTAVTVQASELDSGTKSISSNGTNIDVVGYAAVDVSVPGVDIPVFTVTWDSNYEQILTVTCNKTYAECSELYDDYANAMAMFLESNGVDDPASVSAFVANLGTTGGVDYIRYTSPGAAMFYYDINYFANGTITATYPSQYNLTLNATTNGTYTPSNGMYTEVNVNVPTGTARTSADLSASGATVIAPAGLYAAAATYTMPSGTAGTPTATKGTVSNHSISVTPSVTNTTGYITGSTKTGTAVTVSASELVSGTYSVTSSGTKDVTNYASASVPAGTEGTPSATKGTVSNHSVSVTPSVTNTAGYISGGTKTGTAVTVQASELVSGSETKTANGTYDVTNLASLVVAIPIVTYYTGNAAPSSSLGSNGDIYLQTS